MFLPPIQLLIILTWLIYGNFSKDLGPDRTKCSSFDYNGYKGYDVFANVTCGFKTMLSTLELQT